MRVAVCGSRTFPAREVVEHELDALVAECRQQGEALTVIDGGAPGVDRFARDWARQAPQRDGVPIDSRTFPADWARCGPDCDPTHRRPRRHRPGSYCPAAGPRRNQQILDEAQPDQVIAFTDKPLGHSRGTVDMVHRALVAGIPLRHVHHPTTGAADA